MVFVPKRIFLVRCQTTFISPVPEFISPVPEGRGFFVD
jgi:hypothetical protein